MEGFRLPRQSKRSAETRSAVAQLSNVAAGDSEQLTAVIGYLGSAGGAFDSWVLIFWAFVLLDERNKAFFPEDVPTGENDGLLAMVLFRLRS